MLDSWLKAIKNIFFPPLCIYCENKTNNTLCPACLQKISFLYPPLCRYCSKPIRPTASGLCAQCFTKPRPYKVISALEYKEPIISLIHLFKYKNYAWLGEFLTGLLIEHLDRVGFNSAGYDLIVAVPMHKHKLKTRGYNQACIIAGLLSKYFKIPHSNGIINNVHIRPPQAKLSQSKRLKNVDGSFIAKENLNGKKILLIDDIFTTGSTVTACCQALKQAQAQDITIITLAKTITKPLKSRTITPRAGCKGGKE